jgi:para-nitrobenzyl esterase
VRFQGGDDATAVPADRSRYTLEFGADGIVRVRLDCNRGRARWSSPGNGRLRFDPLAKSRAECGPGSLHDLIARHWIYVRSYTLKGGHLFLALMADGGVYELEPLPARK